MLHARQDYDAIQPWPQKRPHHARIDGEVVMDVEAPAIDIDLAQPIIPEDEPVALIRGQDPVGWRAALAWADFAELAGADAELVEAMRQHAGKMRAWAESHGKRVPDAPREVLRLS